jgi:hypothetical protein
MAGDENAGLRVIAMRQRNAGIGRAPARRRDARTHLERNAMLGELLDLLAAAPEDERIAALEPQHALALFGQRHQHLADFLLRHGMVGAALADIDALGLAADEIEDVVADQPVVEHDIGLLHEPLGAEGEQIGIARPGADEIDLARHGRAVLARQIGCERALRSGLVARQHHFRDRPFERALPEPSPALNVRQAGRSPAPAPGP